MLKLFTGGIISSSLSLSSIQKNARKSINANFADYIHENIKKQQPNNKQVEKESYEQFIAEKLKGIENPFKKPNTDYYLGSKIDLKKEPVSLTKVLQKFKTDAEKFLKEATDEELKILQKYYVKTNEKDNLVDSWLSSTNKCTDKKDDGKIGFISIVSNIVEGAAKTAVGCLKDILTDDKKLFGIAAMGLLMFGLSCTAIGATLLPILGLVTSASLVTKGLIKIGKNAVKASKATTDAEAKQCWENVGNGALHVGVGALVGRKSFKDAKGIFKDGRASINTNAQEVARNNWQEINTSQGIRKVGLEIFTDPENFIDD